MNGWRWGVAAAVLLGLLGAGSAEAQTGAGSVLWKKKGSLVSQRKPGDTAGIQAALDSVGPGGTVQVDAGRYSITATLRSRFAGVTIIGTSDSTVWENGSANGDTIIVITGANTTMRGISIDGRKGVKSDGYGIHVEAQNVLLEDLWIYNTPDAAIHVHQGSHRAHVENCLIEYPGDVTSTVADGIIVHDSDDAKVINNRIFGTKRYGIWVQGTSRRTKIEGNTVNGTVNDGINVDNTTLGVNILNNHVYAAGVDGIECNGDSMQVGGNTVSRAGDFGIWSVNGGSASNWWGNICLDSGRYSMGITITNGNLERGWLITGNLLSNARGPNFELECDLGATIFDVQFMGNYLLGNKPSETGAAFSGLKLTGGGGGMGNVDRVHLIGNVIKDSRRHGIEIAGAGGGRFSDVVVTENHMLGNALRGIATTSGGTGSNVFISDNYVRSNGTGPESLAVSGWTYEGLGKRRVRASSVVVEDSLRVNGTATFLGAVVMPPPSFTDVVTTGKIVGEDSLRIGTSTQTSPATITGNITGWRDLQLRNNVSSIRWTNSTGAYQPVIRVDSVNVLRLQAITGGHVDVMGTDGAVRARFGGTGGLCVTGPGAQYKLGGFTALIDAGVDRRIVPRDVLGNVVVRNFANDTDNLTIGDTGNTFIEGKGTVEDSLRVNGPIVTDSGLRVSGSGYVTGNFDFGSAGALTKSGTSGDITLPAPGNRINFSFAGDNWVGPIAAGGALALSSNGGANKTIYLPGTGDEAQVNGKLSVRDSMHVFLSPEFGFRDNGGVLDSLRIGREMAFVKYGSTSDIFLHNTGNIIEFTNDGTNVIRASDAAGTLSFHTGGSTARLVILSDGDVNIQGSSQFRLGSSTHGSLPAHDNGSLIYCSDCTKATPCGSGGTGAIAKRLNGAWDCN